MESGFKVYEFQHGLENLLRRLQAGMVLKGRVVDHAGSGLYIVRIRGYNILTRSEEPMRRFDEVQLAVKEVEPNLILELSKGARMVPASLPNRTSSVDILVNGS